MSDETPIMHIYRPVVLGVVGVSTSSRPGRCRSGSTSVVTANLVCDGVGGVLDGIHCLVIGCVS